MTGNRELVAQVVIVLAVCLGAWMMWVQPRAAELARLEQTIQDAQNPDAAGSEQTIEGLAGKLEAIRQRLAVIKSKNDLAGDSSQLYGMVMTLAEAHDIQVESMQPVAAQSPIKDAEFGVTRLELSFQGGFQQTAAFVDAILSMPAFVRPQSLEISPTQGGAAQLVSGRLSCEVLGFTIPDPLLSLGEAHHAQ